MKICRLWGTTLAKKLIIPVKVPKHVAPTHQCLCGTQPQAQRAQIKAMLQDWERANPGRLDTIFRAMQDIRPSQLGDSALFDFAALEAQREAMPDRSDDAPVFEHYSSTHALFSFD